MTPVNLVRKIDGDAIRSMTKYPADQPWRKSPIVGERFRRRNRSYPFLGNELLSDSQLLKA
jgi:hypothetical protein